MLEVQLENEMKQHGYDMRLDQVTSPGRVAYFSIMC